MGPKFWPIPRLSYWGIMLYDFWKKSIFLIVSPVKMSRESLGNWFPRNGTSCFILDFNGIEAHFARTPQVKEDGGAWRYYQWLCFVMFLLVVGPSDSGSSGSSLWFSTLLRPLRHSVHVQFKDPSLASPVDVLIASSRGEIRGLHVTARHRRASRRAEETAYEEWAVYSISARNVRLGSLSGQPIRLLTRERQQTWGAQGWLRAHVVQHPQRSSYSGALRHWWRNRRPRRVKVVSERSGTHESAHNFASGLTTENMLCTTPDSTLAPAKLNFVLKEPLPSSSAVDHPTTTRIKARIAQGHRGWWAPSENNWWISSEECHREKNQTQTPISI